MTEPVLLVEAEDGIATVTLNRPGAMNALSRELRVALEGAFRSLAADPAVGVVILTGAGDRAFCAGLDLKELGGEGGGSSDGEVELAVSGGEVVRAISETPQPVIGAVNGFAITGGFELALACDVLVGSTAARFADTHARVGILPGWGLSQKLSRLVGLLRAKEISLTGNFVDASTACAWGLLNRVVEPADLLPTCRSLARDMLSCDQPTLRGYKRLVDEGFATNFGEALRLEARASRAHSVAVKPRAIAERRAKIQERGRSQSRK
ncbi:enoyl-CoA hydratase [bacterium]|nr:enoyl-CoA hydratase [bacterium]